MTVDSHNANFFFYDYEWNDAVLKEKVITMDRSPLETSERIFTLFWKMNLDRNETTKTSKRSESMDFWNPLPSSVKRFSIVITKALKNGWEPFEQGIVTLKDAKTMNEKKGIQQIKGESDKKQNQSEYLISNEYFIK